MIPWVRLYAGLFLNSCIYFTDFNQPPLANFPYYTLLFKLWISVDIYFKVNASSSKVDYI